MSQFEVFKNRRQRAGAAPTMTISARGHLLINQSAFEALGEPDAATLLFDRDEQLVGLRAAETGATDAYLVRRMSPNRTYAISATAFVRHYGIATKPTRRRPATLRDGVLCIDLRHPGVEVTSNRARPAIAAD